MDDDATVKPLADEYALLGESVTGEGAVVGGGLTLHRECGVGVGVAVVDDTLEAVAWFMLQQVHDPLQIAVQSASGFGDPAVAEVMVDQFQGADVDALPVEPVVQVLNGGALGLKYGTVSVFNLVKILDVHSGGEICRFAHRNGARGRYKRARLEIGVGVAPSPGTGCPEIHPDFDNICIGFREESEPHAVGKVDLLPHFQDLDGPSGSFYLGRGRCDKDSQQGRSHKERHQYRSGGPGYPQG